MSTQQTSLTYEEVKALKRVCKEFKYTHIEKVKAYRSPNLGVWYIVIYDNNKGLYGWLKYTNVYSDTNCADIFLKNCANTLDKWIELDCSKVFEPDIEIGTQLEFDFGKQQ